MIDALVDDRFQRLTAIDLQVLPDAVEDDDGVIHRVADQRQQRGDHCEGDLLVEQGEESDRDNRIVKHRNHRAHAVDPFEAEPDVDQHSAQREQRGLNRLLPQVGCNLGAHHFHLPDGEGSKITLLFENVNDISINPGNSRELIETGNQAGLGWAVAESENVGDQLLQLRLGKSYGGALQGVAQPAGERLAGGVVKIQLPGLLAESGVQRGHHGTASLLQGPFVLQFGADDHLVRVGAGEGLNIDTAGDFSGQRRADFVQRGRARKLHVHHGAATEVDPVFDSALHGDTDQSRRGEHQGSDDKRPLLAQKVEVRVFE